MLNEVVVGSMKEAVNNSKLDRGISIIDLKANSASQMMIPLYKYVRENDFKVCIAFSPEIACDLLFIRILSFWI